MQQSGINGRKFAVLFRYDSTNTWYRGPQRFDTEEEACEYGHNSYQLHSSIKAWRVMLMPDGEAGGQE